MTELTTRQIYLPIRLATFEPMSRFHLIRVGAMGQVGRFAAVDAVRYPRHSRVIVRTRRGLEIGGVLSEPDDRDDARAFADGEMLRGMTVEDELLQARLEKHRHEAYEACAQLLAEQQVAGRARRRRASVRWPGPVLLFPGRRAAGDRIVYRPARGSVRNQVQFRKFTETLIEGCGPGCGTEEAKGQGGCESCTSCAVASACGTKRPNEMNGGKHRKAREDAKRKTQRKPETDKENAQMNINCLPFAIFAPWRLARFSAC